MENSVERNAQVESINAHVRDEPICSLIRNLRRYEILQIENERLELLSPKMKKRTTLPTFPSPPKMWIEVICGRVPLIFPLFSTFFSLLLLAQRSNRKPCHVGRMFSEMKFLVGRSRKWVDPKAMGHSNRVQQTSCESRENISLLVAEIEFSPHRPSFVLSFSDFLPIL